MRRNKSASRLLARSFDFIKEISTVGYDLGPIRLISLLSIHVNKWA